MVAAGMLAVLLVGSACTITDNTPTAGDPTPPAQPTSGYGSNGPCTVPSTPVNGAGAASGLSLIHI